MSTHLKRLEPRHEAAHTESEEKTQKRRKAKAPTLKEKDWEPYKKLIINLHITQKMSLEKVRSVLATERGFIAETSQYRFRISKWGLDKKIKTEEMETIVRKRQHRALVETHKPELRFQVRGRVVDPEKIERWMRRHDIPGDRLYAEIPETPITPGVSCRTISQRSSPVPDLATVVDLLSDPGFVGPHLNGPSLHRPVGQQWLNNATSTRPINQKSAVQTENLLWCLDTPWKHLIRGHKNDPEGAPLAALAGHLIEELEEIDYAVSAVTLAELLRETVSDTEREWDPIEPPSSDSSEIIPGIIWELSARTIGLGDPLDTILVSVSMRSTKESRGPSRSLDMRFRWSAAEPCYTTGLAKPRTLSGGKEDGPIFDAIDNHDTIKVRQMISEDEAAIFEKDWAGRSPVSVSAWEGDVESTRVLIESGSTVNNVYDTHHNILWPIWNGFACRWGSLAIGCGTDKNVTARRPSFEDDFARCKVLTSLALKHGARIDECVHYSDTHGNLLHAMIWIENLKLAQWRRILQYLLQLGVNKDFRNHEGDTPLLLAVGSIHDSEPVISALLSHNVDISMKDNAGSRCLHLALARLGEMCETGRIYKGQKRILLWERRLAVLLEADPNAMATINSADTPLCYIMDNEVAWEIWSRVHTQLGWSMENSENIRSTRMVMARGNNVDYR